MLSRLIFLLLVILIGNLVFVPCVSSSEFVTGELILKLKRSPELNNLLDLHKKGQGILTNLPVLDELNREFKVTEMRKLLELHPSVREISIQAIDLTDIFKLILPADSDLEAVAAAYRKNPLVEYAEPNYIRRISYTPNDPSLSWGLSKVEAYSAWDITSGSSDVVIAVVDTGLDWNHPDLAANVWINAGEIPGNGLDDDGNGFVDDYMGWDFTDAPGGPGAMGEDYLKRDNDPMDFHGHGTHVAGIVAAVANNSQGSAGLAYGCKVMAVRSGYKTSNGGGLLEDDDCAAAIIYAADNGAKVINMSWGGSSPSSLIQDALDYAASRGCLLIGAAGNSNTSSIFYPAGYTNVLAIAATTSNDSKASFSNYGNWIDVSAPGTGIYSTLFDNTYASWSGTSMAAPFVAALGGLVFSQNPTWNREKVAQQIRDTADNIDSINPSYAGLLGTGRINAYQAVLPETEPLTPPLSIVLPADTMPAGSTFWADIVLGEDNNAVEDLLGLSFVLTYSETSTFRIMEPTEEHIIIETGSFLGQDLVNISKVDQEKGEIRLGLSRKYPAAGAAGFGRIARLEFQLLSEATVGQVISFNLNEVTARNGADAPIDLSVYPDKLTVGGIIVWPGDTNNDGIVNEIDILPIASYWGLTGPVRDGASSSWEGQPASTWSQPGATYADANGDGVIDERELIPIGLNWALTHSASGSLAAPVAAMESTRRPHPLAAYQAIYRFLRNSPESEAITRMIALLSDLIAEAKAITQIPTITSLEQNYPNPVNPETFIPFHLSHQAKVAIRIYDLSGQLIRTLDLGILEPGSYLNRNMAAYWNGQDEAGNEVASGAYLYQLQTGRYLSTRKLIVHK